MILFLKQFSFLAVALVLLSGCAVSMVNWENQAEILSYVQTQRDDYEKLTWLYGPRFKSNYGSFALLRARKRDGESEYMFQICVRDEYTGKDWRYYDRAFDSEGNKLRFVKIDNEVLDVYLQSGITRFAEEAGMTISRGYLLEHRTSGLDFKITGKRGEQVFTLPPAYISAFLEAVDRSVKSRSPGRQIEDSFQQKEHDRREIEQMFSNPSLGDVVSLDLGGGCKLEIVGIEGGPFQMGSPPSESVRSKDEGPVHSVELDTFWIGKYEVTQAQYQQIMGKNPSYNKGPSYPVEKVSWNDAMEFCRKLSQQTGETFTLPSEAQWEYACRAGNAGKFCFGNSERQLSDYAWYGLLVIKTRKVGMKKPNAWNLYDMHSNVYEWCLDWYDKDFYSKEEASKNPTGPSNGSSRVMRGSSFLHIGNDCRSANRHKRKPDYSQNDLGFRIVLTQTRVQNDTPLKQANTQNANQINSIGQGKTIKIITTGNGADFWPKPVLGISNKLGTILAGTKLEILDEKATEPAGAFKPFTCFKVRHMGKEGWVLIFDTDLSPVKIAADREKRINIITLNNRARLQPYPFCEDGEELARINTGTEMEILAKEAVPSGANMPMPSITFFQVEYKGKKGWVSMYDTNLSLLLMRL